MSIMFPTIFALGIHGSWGSNQARLSLPGDGHSWRRRSSPNDGLMFADALTCRAVLSSRPFASVHQLLRIQVAHYCRTGQTTRKAAVFHPSEPHSPSGEGCQHDDAWISRSQQSLPSIPYSPLERRMPSMIFDAHLTLEVNRGGLPLDDDRTAVSGPATISSRNLRAAICARPR